ncbi:MAG: PIN/TRAM domain-containing protein [Peptococcia bacterium]
MIRKIIRFLIALVFIGGGLSLGYSLRDLSWLQGFNSYLKPLIIIVPGLIFGLIGFFIAPLIISFVVSSTEWTESKLQKMPMTDLAGAAIGLIIGLIIASLLGVAFARIPIVGGYIAIFFVLLLGYLGMSIGMKKKDDLLGLFTAFTRTSREKEKGVAVISGSKAEQAKQLLYKILDTSVIIDGRIADIVKSGFIDGVLVIPSFVLEELRHIADSSDPLKRNRGRRGLDMLNKIRKELDVKVRIEEQDFQEIQEVDSKLIKLAQVMSGEIITNDYNLNKVAELQGIKVLNINELANALKPVYIPGEEMVVTILKDGKESKQGIGYLDDGTMIVVEGGRKYINQTINVMVTSVLQTAAGRMIFAKPKYNDDRTLFEVDASG